MGFFKIALNIVLFLVFWLLWCITISRLTTSPPEYPTLRARLGTVLWHSQDGTNPSDQAEHLYCYLPKSEANSKILLKRTDDGNCDGWISKIILTEGWWVSEREKYWWSREQHIADCGDCTDL